MGEGVRCRMTVCEHCKYRNGWECGDGWNRQEGGCEEFKLDWDTLSDKQKEAIHRHLKIEEMGDTQ